MKITSTEIRIKLKTLWPNLKYVWLVDTEYWCPSKAKIRQLLIEDKTDLLNFIPGLQDCDDFALQLHAAIKRARVWEVGANKVPREEWLPYVFGEILGYEFRGMQYNHAINIVICKEGVYLIEPQDDRMWEATSNNDRPYFVRM